ncbi:CBO0543 family protein [Mesobacillus foraminis]|uniref:CBO0543 family protein n=1 Tax=Mesobacillus foraminis TaxID=279826 RepID=UPI000EF4A59A|nr:CBO0543 family protein [Mesobacillus foraminis]
MNKAQLEMIETIRKAEIEQSHRWTEYWQDYSHFFTWQIWIVLAMFVLPLIITILFIDRKKAFHIGFYGYSVHVFFAYTDVMGTSNGLWIYPYKMMPYFPSNVTLDASLVPVSYMLLYQYILNNGKNYYLWMIGLSLGFSYILKPLFVGLGLFHFGGKENFFMLFLGYVTVGLIAKWLTDFFVFLQKSNILSLRRGEKPSK